MSELKGRRVSLVLIDSDGELLGETPEVDLPSPHWQEVAPITDVFPWAVILRLLSVSHATPDRMSTHITYLAQSHLAFDDLKLKPYLHKISDHPLRMPWAKPTGPEQDLRWAESQVEFSGKPVQHRTWNLSSIWSIPCRSGIVWLKCVPPFLEHESTVLKALQNFSVPQVIACDGHRMLLEDLPGHDGYQATEDDRRQAVQQLVEMQTQTLEMCETLKRDGVPHQSLESLRHELLRILHEKGASDSRSLAFMETLSPRVDGILEHGIPECIVHGDLHAGNFRIGISPPIIFDWGDSFIGHPFLDMGHIQDSETLGFWLSCWQSYYPDADVNYVWEQIRPIARLRSALVYERFCANIEAAERVYHASDIDDVIATFLD